MTCKELREVVEEYKQLNKKTENVGKCAIVLLTLGKEGHQEIGLCLAKGQYQQAYELIDELEQKGTGV